MAGHDLGHAPRERQATAPEVAVRDRQGVLVRLAEGLFFEELWGRVGGRHAAGVTGLGVFQDPRQAEIGHLHAAPDQQQVLRLDVPVLDPHRLCTPRGVAGLVQVVEPPGRVQEMLVDLRRGDAGEPLAGGLAEAVQERPLGQFHRDDEVPPDLPGPEGGQKVGVADVLDDLQGAEFERPDRLGQAHELQRQLEPARPGGLPDFAAAAPAEPLDQSVSGDGLRAGLQGDLHCPRLRLWVPPG